MIVFLLWSCGGESVDGWLTGELTDRDSIIEYQEEQSLYIGGLFGEFSVVSEQGFSSGRGGFTVLKMDETGEEFLCGLNYEIDFVAVAQDCSACTFAFEVYEQEVQQQGQEEYCGLFGVSESDYGSRYSFIGYGGNQAYTKQNGEWVAFGVAEYRDATQEFMFHEVQETQQ